MKHLQSYNESQNEIGLNSQQRYMVEEELTMGSGQRLGQKEDFYYDNPSAAIDTIKTLAKMLLELDDKIKGKQ